MPMTHAATEAERLLDEAESQPFTGWDFSWLAGRMTTTSPWDFAAIVAKRARRSPDLMDMGTGGGEWLAALSARAPFTVATESWPPNIPVAARRLRPLGISVVRVEGAPDNVTQRRETDEGRLPFGTGAFRLIVNRHESFLASEVARVLARDGSFLSQQVGDGLGDDVYPLFSLPKPPRPSTPWRLSLAVSQLQDAGLTVVAGGESAETMRFSDVGALAWYLKNLPWVFPDFSITAFRPALIRLHDEIALRGPVAIRQPLFWLDARKTN